MTVSESLEQRILLVWLRARGLRHTHVANESASKMQRIKNARNGVSPGFPDLVVLLPGVTIAIELKRKVGGRVSPAQAEWITALNDSGVPARVCRGAAEAIAFVEEMLARTASVV